MGLIPENLDLHDFIMITVIRIHISDTCMINKTEVLDN